jgi:hypothetical protein
MEHWVMLELMPQFWVGQKVLGTQHVRFLEKSEHLQFMAP